MVDDPAGFAAINNGSLVYMIGGNRALTDVISRGSWPAALINNKVISRHEQRMTMIVQGVDMRTIDKLCPDDEEDQRLNMIAGCQDEPLPNAIAEGGNGTYIAFKDGSWTDVNIYWRKKD